MNNTFMYLTHQISIFDSVKKQNNSCFTWFIRSDVNQQNNFDCDTLIRRRVSFSSVSIRELVKWFSYDRFLCESAHFIFQSSGLWSDCRLSSSLSLQATQRRPSGPMGGLVVARGHVWSADSWPAHNIHPDGLFSPEPHPPWSHPVTSLCAPC